MVFFIFARLLICHWLKQNDDSEHQPESELEETCRWPFPPPFGFEALQSKRKEEDFHRRPNASEGRRGGESNTSSPDYSTRVT